eukprot:11212882-Ditylum_brightwellii.AAC.1
MESAQIWTEGTTCTPTRHLRCAQQNNHARNSGDSGTFLYYGRAIDGTILPTIYEISADQAKPTINTAKQSTMLMDYL